MMEPDQEETEEIGESREAAQLWTTTCNKTSKLCETQCSEKLKVFQILYMCFKRNS